MNYRIIRSNRKTIGLEVKDEGLIVRAPFRISDDQIEVFIAQHKDWIDKKLKMVEERRKIVEELQPLSMEEINELAERAMQVIPERVKYYAAKIGVSYGRITIRNQRTRWGSCSGKGNLNFNCLLMLTPPEVLDSIVVHELCHRKEMSHSGKFYEEVLKVYPDYWIWDKWLKENGALLIKRMCKSEENSATEKNYTYILECADGTYYCGWTNNLEKRLAAHNSGRGSKYTRARLPVRLVYYEEYPSKQEAMSRECQIKRLSREEKRKLIKQRGH